jgi:hypothetical protein
MTDTILKLINREFACIGAPYCENDGRTLVHSRGCPAAFRLRATQLARKVLLEVIKDRHGGNGNGRVRSGDSRSQGAEERD